ncbi:MAG TPA: hypothetical protein VD908_08050 [Cytophagales bacterium]|nr:hypothetical protein [Cytophagales bacterium]
MKYYLPLFLIFFIFGALSFIPPQTQRLELEESIIIKNNAQAVYEEIIDFNRMGKWYSPVNGNKATNYRIQEAEMLWFTQNNKESGYTILHKNSGPRFKKQIVFYTFLEPLKDPAIEEFNIEETPVGTIVTWSFKLEFEESGLAQPWSEKEIIQSHLKRKITNLKQQVEARPKFNTFISTRDFDRFYYFSTTAIVNEKSGNIQLSKEACLQKLYQFLDKHSIAKSGNRIIFKENLPNGNIKLTYGIGVRQPVNIIEKDIKLDSLPEGRAVVAEIEGSEKSLDPYHSDVEKYLTYFSFQPKGNGWEEEFVTNYSPQSVPVRRYVIQPVIN